MSALRGDRSSPSPEPSQISSSDFREVLGRFASGLVVVAAESDKGPVGFTCQSFFSVSLDPPLIAISVRRGSATWELMKAGGRLSVNILSAGQHDLARRFGHAAADKFAGVAWTSGPGGPRLDGALAYLSCTIDHVTDAGDHHLVTAQVIELDSRQGEPLLFYRGKFGCISSGREPDPATGGYSERVAWYAAWGAVPVTRRRRE
jgi:3-hydroxy-9,10-secoandrosta-1,3,5(10)-triene-9,17-dione monooxygenase reductase component